MTIGAPQAGWASDEVSMTMPSNPARRSCAQGETILADPREDSGIVSAVQRAVDQDGVAALWASEARLRTLLDALPAVVIVLDHDGIYRILGGRQLSRPDGRDEAVGRSVFEVHRDRPDILADVRRALAGEELRAEREAAGVVWETLYAPLRDEAGDVIGVVYVAFDVTARAQVEEALREREARLRTQYQALPLPTYTWQWVDDEFVLVDFNAAADRFAGGPLASKLGQTATQMYGDYPETRDYLARAFADRATVRHEIHSHVQDIPQALDLIVTDVFVAPDLVVMHLEDITERKQAESALRASEASLAAAQRIAHLSSWEYDFVRDELCWSDEAFRIAGHEPQSFVPTMKRFMAFVHPDDQELVRRTLRDALEQALSFDVDYRIVRPTGEIRIVHQLAEIVRDEAGRPIKWVGTGLDVTERRALEARLAHQAFHDALTGLPNRALFLDRLGQSCTRARRDGRSCAVLFLDLDRFKDVNDSLGHSAGDRLLIEVAARLRSGLRDSDTLARLGGDEFAVLLEDVGALEEATRVARRLSQALEPPIAIAGQEHRVTVSIGIVLGSGAEAAPEQLLRDADVAMYRAKADGRAGYAVFDPAMQAQLVERLALEQDLHQALARGEFVLHYQPIVDLRSDQVVKVEALVRWNHPTRGLIGPGVFVKLAEEAGLIRPLGRWVLEEACRQARAWQALLPAVGPPVVSVNLSAREFQDPELASEVARLLHVTGLPPELLELEITEGVVMEDAPTTLNTLLGLKQLGVQLAIDDFGTGYSSLAYLKRFPVDTLKIDRSFVSGPGADTDDMAIIEAIVTVAHTLGLRVTAEGVETAAQVQRFAQLGCALAQGYHFSRPVAADALAELLQRRTALGAPSPATAPYLAPSTAELRQRRTARTRRLLLPTTSHETS